MYTSALYSLLAIINQATFIVQFKYKNSIQYSVVHPTFYWCFYNERNTTQFKSAQYATVITVVVKKISDAKLKGC